jgi:hypothetical protein
MATTDRPVIKVEVLPVYSTTSNSTLTNGASIPSGYIIKTTYAS